MSNPGLTNLKCWWKLDEITNGRSDEMGRVTLAQAGGVGYATGHQTFTGNCADFVASNSERLWTSDPSNHLQAGDFSISMCLWIRPDDVATNSKILAKWGITDREYTIYIEDSKIKFTVRSNGVNYDLFANNFGTLADGYWYFIGAFFNYAGEYIAVSVNDVWDSVAIGTYGITPTSEDFYLGTWGVLTQYYDGLIDEVFFYSDRRLTLSNFTWLYNGGIGRRFEDVSQVAPLSVSVVTERKIPEIYAYNQDLDALGIIDNYSSLNWAERYNSEGDFELELPLSYADSPLLAFGNFLYIPTSDKIMVVEEKKPTRSPTEGKLLVNGRSVESILRRRILTQVHTWFGNAEFYAYHLVYWGVINPADSDRIIGLLEDGSGDVWPPAMETSAEVAEQFATENLYEVIETVLKIVDLGFKIVSNLWVASPKLYFHTYEGLDRSSSQYERPSIIFSYALENLMDSSFLTTEKGAVNITFVKTDDSVYETVFVWEGGSSESPGGTEPAGLNRLEGRLDTTINRDTDGDDIDDLTDAEVLAIIEEKGRVVIKGNTPVTVFDGDVDPRRQFILGEDFFLGDVVQVEAHGLNDKARVIETVKSYSVEGERIYIAFDFEV